MLGSCRARHSAGRRLRTETYMGATSLSSAFGSIIWVWARARSHCESMLPKGVSHHVSIRLPIQQHQQHDRFLQALVHSAVREQSSCRQIAVRHVDCGHVQDPIM